MDNLVKFKCDLMWAQLDKVNDMSGKFQCDLANLSDKAVQALEAIGLEPRKREDKPEKGWFLTVKSNYAIQPYDKEGNEIKDTVGNGSKAVALIKPYSWTWKNKKGISPSLRKLIITDLIEFVGAGGSMDDEDVL